MDAVRARAMAQRMVKNNGVAVLYTRVLAGRYDPATASTGPDASVTFTVPAIITSYGRRWENGGAVVTAGMRFSIAALDLASAPALGDAIRFDNVRYELVTVEPLYAAGQPVMFEMDGQAK